MSAPSLPFQDSRLPIEERIDDLLGRMSVIEKCGQMRYDAPAIERLGIPAYNWWSEALHGVARNGRATVFPQAIGLAATWNAQLVERVADAIAEEARAKHHAAARAGRRGQYQGLTFWTPNINIFRDPRWGRGQETWGEDPHLTGELGAAFVRGLQGPDPDRLKTAACAKHYAAHSGPEADRHHFDAVPPRRDFWETYTPAFKRLVDEGVEAVMGAYNRTYGDPCCGSRFLLTDLLRERWGFRGHVVSDCWAIKDFHEHHKVTDRPEESAALALKSGCDLNCGSVYCDALELAVREGLVDEADLDRALRRLFATRIKLGLLDAAPSGPYADTPLSVVRCEAHLDLALEAARDSIVLLKNANDALPIPETIEAMLIAGPNAASIEPMLGNYYGLSERIVTLVEGILGRVPEGVRIDYRLGCPLDQASTSDLDWAVFEAANTDYVIAAMGLSPVMEGEEGDALRSDNRGDRASIELPPSQVDFLRKVAERIRRTKRGTKLVVLLFGGAPIAAPEVHEWADAVLQVGYPGERGGEAIAQVLWGDAQPGGRLPFTVPVSTAVLPDYADYAMAGRTYRFMTDEAILYPFGFGISYADVAYRDLRLSAAAVAAGDALEVSATVENTGRRDTIETAQCYLLHEPEENGMRGIRLAAFERVAIAAGAEAEIRFVLPAERFNGFDGEGAAVRRTGPWRVYVGPCAPVGPWAPLGAPAPVWADVAAK